MTEPTELLPCPFCGGHARKVKHSAGAPGTTGYDRWHGVACAGCNACVGARDRRFRTSAAAIAAWNRRTPQPTQAQAGAVTLALHQRDSIKANAWRETPLHGYFDADAIIDAVEAAHGIGIKGGQYGAFGTRGWLRWSASSWRACHEPPTT